MFAKITQKQEQILQQEVKKDKKKIKTKSVLTIIKFLIIFLYQ